MKKDWMDRSFTISFPLFPLLGNHLTSCECPASEREWEEIGVLIFFLVFYLVQAIIKKNKGLSGLDQ